MDLQALPPDGFYFKQRNPNDSTIPQFTQSSV